MYPDDVERKNRGFLGFDSSALPVGDRQDRRQLRYELDLNSWNFRIWGVAASGFLTDSYNLFASNVINTSVTYVYFPEQRWPSLVINLFTLGGSACGQLLFGYLADRFGRTRLYGIELLLVIVSTIGVATSSYGYNDMSFLALFCFWRFVMGIGIGAEYPLSAVITSEWSSTTSRATMLSSVFLMQPVGQALAQLVGVWVVLGRNAQYNLQALQCGIDTKYEKECKSLVDGIWRIVIGSGCVPAVLAIIFRFFLYDCGLYSLEVKGKPGTAFRDTQRVYGAPPPGANSESPSLPPLPREPFQFMPVQFSREDLYKYFIKDGNWYYLLGTAATWFFLDVSFYGFSLDKGATLADLWARNPAPTLGANLPCWNSTLEGGTSALPSWTQTGFPAWQTDKSRPCATVYDTLLEQGKQYLITVSIASILGSICCTIFINRFHRRHFLTASFLLLTVLFIITGGVYYGVAHTNAAPVTVVCVAICHFFFNFGANSLTFIIPAEIFPSCYRCTCHGISAAAGKIGSMVAVAVVYGIDTGYRSPTRQGLEFLLFSLFMALGAVYSWAYLPNLQRRRVAAEDPDDHPGGSGKGTLETKNLEDLGEGRERARQDGEIITVKEKVDQLKRRRREIIHSARAGGRGQDIGLR
ncbi:MFS general substrate transporter [Cryphonectria parasitica EP155]|uniref:MFS general substrate transporter n=1 Tax=Cryphonectria parasitica (strain ATCC 38755 / EP155) TaxID=660469 RepID=A0A9P4Y1D8_CRYP1|nr:MFS general substrate transporter [Cryphonectria parasitica EP155]KAF3764771.1 MFS general substrate transporter [Cryphonectria parasitica EP155]